MRQKIISAAVGTFLCLAATAPAMAQDAPDSAGIVQAVYAVIASWIGNIHGILGETDDGTQAIDDEWLVSGSSALADELGAGPEMAPIIVPTG